MNDAPLTGGLQWALCTLPMPRNPFATRYTRPGAIPFLFPPRQSAQTIAAALRDANWWGQIVGPHGSGKSTLLATLLPELAAQGREVVHVALRQGQQLPGDRGQETGGKGMAQGAWPVPPEAWTARTQVVIDGYEQLSWWNRRKLKLRCRRSGAGLLVTSHKPCGLATVFQTAPSLPLAQSIVQKLLHPDDAAITPDDVAKVWQDQGFNLRETLFALYDLYQRRQK